MNLQVTNQRMAKNAIFLSIRMVIVTFISIFTTRYLLINLGVENYGVYNVTIGIVSMCAFLQPSLSNAIQRFYNFKLGNSDLFGATCVFNAGLYIQIGLALAIVAICESVGLWYVFNKLVVPEGRFEAVLWVFHISILSIAISMIQVPYMAVVLAHERMDFYAILNIIDVVLKLIIAYLIKYSVYDKLVFYGLMLCLVNLANLFIYIVFVKRKFPEVYLCVKGIGIQFRLILSFSFWNLLESVARIGKSQGGNMLLNYYFGPVINASRGLAEQIYYAFSSFVESASTAVRPQMVQRYAKGDIGGAVGIFYTLSKFSVLILLMLAYPFYLEIDYVLQLWLGSTVPVFATIFIRLTILWLLVDKLASPITAIIHATGKVKKYHFLSGIINFMTIPIAWVLFMLGMPPFLLYIVFFICAFIAQGVFIMVLKRLLNISISKYLNEVIVKPFFAFFIVAIFPLSISIFLDEGGVRLFLICLSNIVLFSCSLYFVALDTKEKKMLKQLIRLK